MTANERTRAWAEDVADELETIYRHVSNLRADALALSYKDHVDTFTATVCENFRRELDGALVHLARRKAQAQSRVIELGGQVAL